MVKTAATRQDDYDPIRSGTHVKEDDGWQVALKKGSTGKFHFNLVASNGQVIATSEAYERKQSALNGIESVKNNAPGAEIDDQTEE